MLCTPSHLSRKQFGEATTTIDSMTPNSNRSPSPSRFNLRVLKEFRHNDFTLPSLPEKSIANKRNIQLNTRQKSNHSVCGRKPDDEYKTPLKSRTEKINLTTMCKTSPKNIVYPLDIRYKLVLDGSDLVNVGKNNKIMEIKYEWIHEMLKLSSRIFRLMLGK